MSETKGLAEVLHGFAGAWVAVKDGEVVAARDTPYALVAELRDRGIEDATVMRSPAPEEPEVVGFG